VIIFWGLKHYFYIKKDDKPITNIDIDDRDFSWSEL